MNVIALLMQLALVTIGAAVQASAPDSLEARWTCLAPLVQAQPVSSQGMGLLQLDRLVDRVDKVHMVNVMHRSNEEKLVLHQLSEQQVSLQTKGVLRFYIGFVSLWAALLGALWALPFPQEFKRLHLDRILSTIHSVVASTVGLMTWLLVPPTCSIPHYEDHWIRVMCVFSISYFLVDLCSIIMLELVLKWRKVDLMMIWHHCFCIIMYAWSSEANVALWFSASLFINELSVLPLNLLHLLRFKNMHSTLAYKVTGVSLAVVFFACRIVGIPVSFWVFTSHGFCEQSLGRLVYVAVANFVLLFLLNLIWFNKIVRGGLRVLRGTAGKEAGLEAAEDASKEQNVNEGVSKK